MKSPDTRTPRFLGIVLSPVYVQFEGLIPVFDNLEMVGTTAIAVWPTLNVPTDGTNGGRMPDLHIDGYRRLLARPLWGKRELNVDSFLAYEPTPALFVGGPYRPPSVARAVPTAELDRTVPQKMFEEAKRRGMEVHLGIGPFVPPGVRPQDQPVVVDGNTIGPPYIARSACLNNPDARHYALASIEDMLLHYPGIDGLILDWVEFGAYRLEEHFTCFCPHCQAAAHKAGFDWTVIQRDVYSLWERLHTLTDHDLQHALRMSDSLSAFLELLAAYPGWQQFLAFKSQSVVTFYERVRQLLDTLDLETVTLTARGWCPPWNRSSGSDYRALADICGAISPKLFTFDHAVLPRWFGQKLQDWNPALSESHILDTVIAWMNLQDDFEPRSFDLYQIPAPEEPHPARLESYGARLQEVASQVGGRASFYPISHPYASDKQWREMVSLIRESPADGMWVNMYGYLSDPKLEILKDIWR
jgi:hypothetical protein